MAHSEGDKLMACEFCKEGQFTLMSKEVIDDNILAPHSEVTLKQAGYTMLSVFMEVRNGAGYLRMGDISESSCIDHGERIQLNYCPNCGRLFAPLTL